MEGKRADPFANQVGQKINFEFDVIFQLKTPSSRTTRVEMQPNVVTEVHQLHQRFGTMTAHQVVHWRTQHNKISRIRSDLMLNSCHVDSEVHTYIDIMPDQTPFLRIVFAPTVSLF